MGQPRKNELYNAPGKLEIPYVCVCCWYISKEFNYVYTEVKGTESIELLSNQDWNLLELKREFERNFRN